MSKNLSDETLSLPNFQIFRKDRDNLGGGVAIFVDKLLICRRISLPNEYDELEICAVEIFSRNKTVKLICVYRPPSMLSETTNILIDCLKFLTSGCSYFVICGDFNFPNLTWNPPHASGTGCSVNFLAFINSEGFHQFVTEETHTAGNVLDLVIVVSRSAKIPL